MPYPHIENLDDLYAFAKAFEEGSKGMDALSSGGCPGCEECGDEEEPESHFSWSPCQLCGRPLGGQRWPAHYVDEDKVINHINICADCLYYMEYGTLDDQTMLEIKDDPIGADDGSSRNS